MPVGQRYTIRASGTIWPPYPNAAGKYSGAEHVTWWSDLTIEDPDTGEPGPLLEKPNQTANAIIVSLPDKTGLVTKATVGAGIYNQHMELSNGDMGGPAVPGPLALGTNFTIVITTK
jgi:hypothetical protein